MDLDSFPFQYQFIFRPFFYIEFNIRTIIFENSISPILNLKIIGVINIYSCFFIRNDPGVRVMLFDDFKPQIMIRMKMSNEDKSEITVKLNKFRK